VRFEVFIVALLKISVFWYMMLQGNTYAGTWVLENLAGCVCLTVEEKATRKIETSSSET
jgi:hypothetical protein